MASQNEARAAQPVPAAQTGNLPTPPAPSDYMPKGPMAEAIMRRLPHSAVIQGRGLCTFNRSTEDTEEVRRDYGWSGNPASANDCIANLVRIARDGDREGSDKLLYEYNLKMALSTGNGRDKLGSDAGYEKLPWLVMDVATKQKTSKLPTLNLGKGHIPIGITPGFAFDAGFTAAYLEGDRAVKTAFDGVEPARAYNAANACFAQTHTPNVCTVLGYEIGKQVFQAGKPGKVSAR